MKAGVPVSEPFATTSISTVFQDLNDVRSAQYVPSNHRLTWGSMVELRLLRSFPLEGSALCRRIEYMSTTRISEINPSESLPFDATLRVATQAGDLDLPFSEIVDGIRARRTSSRGYHVHLLACVAPYFVGPDMRIGLMHV